MSNDIPKPTDGAITKEDLDATIDRIFKKRDYSKRDDGPRVDPFILTKHGIPFYYEGDTVMMSSDGMKRAREVGAWGSGAVNYKFEAPLDQFRIRGRGTVFITRSSGMTRAELISLVGKTISLGSRDFSVVGVETYALTDSAKTIDVGFLGHYL